MPNTAVTLPYCPYPVTFDTYKGCSHGCKYCFINFRAGGCKVGDNCVKLGESPKSLEKWCKGERSRRNSWCDWNIPLCFGRNSDPFQPIEREKKLSLEALKVFAKYGYPFILTTKGIFEAFNNEYLAVLKDCNVCWQQSMVCSRMDKLEPNAPSFEQKLEAIAKLASIVPRMIVRCQPLFLEMWEEFRANIPLFKKAGAYGVLVETATMLKPRGMCNVFEHNCYAYPMESKIPVYERLREDAHANDLVFLSGDVRDISDSLECCGCEGMKDFEPNRCNVIFKEFGEENQFQVRPNLKKRVLVRFGKTIFLVGKTITISQNHPSIRCFAIIWRIIMCNSKSSARLAFAKKKGFNSITGALVGGVQFPKKLRTRQERLDAAAGAFGANNARARTRAAANAFRGPIRTNLSTPEMN